MHHTNPMPNNIAREHHPSITSTQTRARELASQSHPTPLLITADRQTAGLGRTGRHWESPPGGLWCTLLWPLPPHHQHILNALGLRVGLAVARAVRQLLAPAPSPPDVRLKWPNDVLLVRDGHAQKLAGTLIEIKRHAPNTYALLGVGLNLNNDPALLPPHLAPHATSLRAHFASDIPSDVALEALLHHLLDALSAEGVDQARLAEIRALLWNVGETVTVTLADGERVEGVLLAVSDDGRLQLERDGRPWLAPLSAELAPPSA